MLLFALGLLAPANAQPCAHHATGLVFAKPAMPPVLPAGRASAHFHHQRWVATASDVGKVYLFDEQSGRTGCGTEAVGGHPTDACQQDPRSMSDGGVMVRRWCGTYPEWLTDVQISPDDSWVVATGIAGSLAVWRTQDLTRVTLDAPGVQPSRLEGLDFSPDGRFLAVAGDYGDYAVRIYDLRSEHRWSLPFAEGPTKLYGMEVVFSPDGRRIAIGYWGGAVEVRGFPDGDLLWTRDPTIRNWAAPMLFTPDGRALLVFESDGVSHLNARTGELQNHWTTLRLEDLDVSSDGRWIVGRTSNRELVRWSLPALTLKGGPAGGL